MKLFSSSFELRRKDFLTKLHLDYEELVSAKLEHGANIEIVENSSVQFFDYTDGLLTQNSEIILSVTVADCFPVFLFDPIQKTIGVLHCGWRSVAKGILENALMKMEAELKSDLKDVCVGIGPGIQACHFEVSEDFKTEFGDFQEAFQKRGGKIFFDLEKVIRGRLIGKGIKEENIKIDSRCTFCDKNLWSFRRDGKDKDDNVRAMMALIKLQNEY